MLIKKIMLVESISLHTCIVHTVYAKYLMSTKQISIEINPLELLVLSMLENPEVFTKLIFNPSLKVLPIAEHVG
jgi:hypothetical protein